VGKPAQFAKKCAVFMLIPLLAQCGGKKSRSSNTTFEVLPDEPIVILGDTLDQNGNSIKGPWFQFRVAMTNNDTSSKITVVALELTITSEDNTGSIKSTDVSFSPTTFNHSISDGGTGTIDCKYTDFGEFSPGVPKGFLLLDPLQPGKCDAIPVFMIGGGTSGISGHNFRYRVKARPLGWFGPYATPEDRFDTFFNFSTK
jgi:hypothetical protein